MHSDLIVLINSTCVFTQITHRKRILSNLKENISLPYISMLYNLITSSKFILGIANKDVIDYNIELRALMLIKSEAPLMILIFLLCLGAYEILIFIRILTE